MKFGFKFRAREGGCEERGLSTIQERRSTIRMSSLFLFMNKGTRSSPLSFSKSGGDGTKRIVGGHLSSHRIKKYYDVSSSY